MNKSKHPPRQRIGSPKNRREQPLFARLGDATFPLDLAACTPDVLQRHIHALDTYITRLTTPSRATPFQRSRPLDAETKALVVRARLHRGVACALLGRWSQAHQDVAHVVEVDPGSAEARTARLFLALASEIDQDDHDRATREWTQVIESIETQGIGTEDTSSRILAAQAYAARARLSARRQDYTQAIADCERALELDPACAEAYSVRGAACGHLERTEAALADCSKAIERAGWPVHYSRRALLYKRTEAYARALADIEQACQMEPDNPRFHNERADILMRWLWQRVTPAPLPPEER